MHLSPMNGLRSVRTRGVDAVARAQTQSATNGDTVLPAHCRRRRKERKAPHSCSANDTRRIETVLRSRRRSLCKASHRCNADSAFAAIGDARDSDLHPHADTTRCGIRALRTVGNIGKPRDTDHAARHSVTMCATHPRAGAARSATASGR